MFKAFVLAECCVLFFKDSNLFLTSNHFLRFSSDITLATSSVNPKLSFNNNDQLLTISFLTLVSLVASKDSYLYSKPLTSSLIFFLRLILPSSSKIS